MSRGKLGKPSALRPGSDGKSLTSFALRLDDEVAHISSRLRQGTYQFSNLDPHFVPKANGKGVRVICSPVIADRVVQRSILDAVGRRQPWMTNPVSFGFVFEKSVRQAAEKATNYRASKPWAFKTDITKFFDNIDRDELRNRVRKHVRQKSLHPLILAAIDCEITAPDKATIDKIKQQGIRHGRGVRQGMPLSPFFANLYLADFDKACVKRKISALRYADDLILFAATKEEALDYQTFCESELSRVGLSIPQCSSDGKTQIYAPGENAEFLGVEIAPDTHGGYVVTVSDKQLAVIKSAIYELGSISELRKMGLDITKFGNSLAARCSAYSATYEYCDNAQKLDASLKDWARATKTRVAKALGINVDALSSDSRWFLGLD